VEMGNLFVLNYCSRYLSCWSYVGMREMFAIKGQPLSLGPECDTKGVILHEVINYCKRVMNMCFSSCMLSDSFMNIPALTATTILF
jgi:hypothetical protein